MLKNYPESLFPAAIIQLFIFPVCYVLVMKITLRNIQTAGGNSGETAV